MKNLWTQFKHTMTTYDIELVEVMSGIAALAWGLWLLIPPLDSFASSPTYNTMAMIAPEWLWGLAMSFFGSFQVQAAISHTLRSRKIAAITSSVMWLFITTMLAIGNLASTATVIYGVFTVFTVWSYLRISQRVEIRSKYQNDHV